MEDYVTPFLVTGEDKKCMNVCICAILLAALIKDKDHVDLRADRSSRARFSAWA
jgi:hypothetical protein